MGIKVGINGFGRIGRMVFRAGLKNPNIEFVAVNHTADTAKAIDTYFDTHFTVFLLNVLMKFSVDVIIIH